MGLVGLKFRKIFPAAWELGARKRSRQDRAGDERDLRPCGRRGEPTYGLRVHMITTGGAAEVAGTGLRACIVDDHAAVRTWLTRKLEGLGIEVCGASETLADGVREITAQRPHLAVIDNRLPDGRGIDLCRQISAAEPGVTLILHTGMISPVEETQAYEAGVARIALKSIQGDDLLAAVEEFAARHREAGE
jgi:CheY-like chemotaxis protein